MTTWICRHCAGWRLVEIPHSLFRLGVARLLRSENIGPAHELDWGESLSLPGFTIHCVPALHFSSRGIYDRNMTLWCGYVIECQERLVYFAGDTGVRTSFRPDSGKVRIAAPRVIADRSVRTTLVHVAGAYGSR